MQHLRLLVELAPDAVAAELAHNREAVAFGVLLDDGANVAQSTAGLDRGDAEPHALVGDLGQAPGDDARRGFAADHEHAAGVAMKAVLDHRDVEVDDVALLQRLVTGHAMADLVVDRGADRLGVGGVAGRGIVERRRNGVLHIDHVIVAQAVELAGGHARLDERLDVVEDLGGQLAGHAHVLDLFRGLDDDAHYVFFWNGGWKAPRLSHAPPARQTRDGARLESRNLHVLISRACLHEQAKSARPVAKGPSGARE